MEFEDTLRNALHHDAAQLVVTGNGAAAARRRGLRRRNRGRAGVAVLGSMSIVGAGLAAWPRGTAAHKVSVRPGASTGLDAAPKLAWQRVAGEVLGEQLHLTTTDGVTYALSTAPGQAAPGDGNAPQALYRTTDGLRWTNASSGEKPWISDVAAKGNVLYAVGTAPGATAADLAFQLGTSTNDGGSWQRRDLPVTLAPPSNTTAWNVSRSLRVASGEHGLVVLASASYFPEQMVEQRMNEINSAHDPSIAWSSVVGADGIQLVKYGTCIANLPPGGTADLKKATARRLTIAAGTGAATTIAPNRQIAPKSKQCDPSVVDTITWAELGVSGAADLARTQVLVSDDARTWNTVQGGFGGGSVSDVTAMPNGFLAHVSSQAYNLSQGDVMTSDLYGSPDGRTWSKVTTTPPGVQIQQISGARVFATDQAMTSVYASNDGGATWSTSDLATLVPHAANESVTIGMSDAGPLGFAVEVEPRDLSVNTPPTNAERSLLHSTDGVTWSLTDLTKQGAPAKGYVTQVRVGADHVDVAFVTDDQQPGGAAKSAVIDLVGTPEA